MVRLETGKTSPQADSGLTLKLCALGGEGPLRPLGWRVT